VDLSSEFETGAGIQLRSPEPGLVTFLAPWDSSPQPMWFHFRIRGAKGRRVRFVLLNAGQCLGGPRSYSELRVRPVVTDDPPHLPPSQRRWRRVPKEDLEYDEASGAFRFEAMLRSDEAYVAHCYPYGPAEWGEFLRDFRRNSCLAAGVLGATENGRAMPEARITEGDTAGKSVIWLAARHHSGETPGSWALEGTLRWLLSDDDQAGWLRRRHLFRVVPFADPDGVICGYYGKERAPVDFNRAYFEDTPRPEVGHILREVCAMGQRNVAFLDYHAPTAGGPHQLFIKSFDGRSSEISKEFGRALAEASPRRSPLEPKYITVPSYMGDEKEITSAGAAYLVFGMLAATIEVSYALTHDDQLLTRKDYLAYGAAVGKALYRVLEAHAGEIPAMGLTEREEERRPFAEYEGRAFLGGFQWICPQDARLSSLQDAQGEALEIILRKKSSSVHHAGPRRRLGKRQVVRMEWRFAGRSKKAARVQVTVFYYGRSGLRLRKAEQFLLDTARARRWRTMEVKLDPPRGARKARLSILVNGGPGRFAMRPAVFR